jgi:anti-sigma regulatory factor (Ser/Thr protein kinase)
MRSVFRVPVTEGSQAAEARRIAVNAANNAGFSETDVGKVAIVVTEAGTNIAKFATGGEILISTRQSQGVKRLEMLAIDRGPGMNVDQCLIDEYSTSGTRGTGLGAISRLASEFDAYSDEKGTIVFAGFVDGRPAQPTAEDLHVGSARAPKPGETVCGDDWALVTSGANSFLLVADGLGHGPFAAEASAEAVKALETNAVSSAKDAVTLVHGALKGTRGAAIAVAEIAAGGGGITYCGLGNIAGVLLSASGMQHLVSLNGTAGHEAARISTFQYSWPDGATLVMHSDGVVGHWSTGRYPGLLRRHPSVIAGILYRDFNRGRDDTAIIVAQRQKRVPSQ